MDSVGSMNPWKNLLRGLLCSLIIFYFPSVRFEFLSILELKELFLVKELSVFLRQEFQGQ